MKLSLFSKTRSGSGRLHCEPSLRCWLHKIPDRRDGNAPIHLEGQAGQLTNLRPPNRMGLTHAASSWETLDIPHVDNLQIPESRWIGKWEGPNPSVYNRVASDLKRPTHFVGYEILRCFHNRYRNGKYGNREKGST